MHPRIVECDACAPCSATSTEPRCVKRETASVDQRVCRRAACRNAVASDCCAVPATALNIATVVAVFVVAGQGQTGRILLTVLCLVFAVLVSAALIALIVGAPMSMLQPPHVHRPLQRCRRRNCQNEVAQCCSSGFCRTHCFSRSCTPRLHHLHLHAEGCADARIDEVRRAYPQCQIALAVYLHEVMGQGRERAGESQLRQAIRGICRDFDVEFANPCGVSTHRSGSGIDLVIASRSMCIQNLVVHDGRSCACPAKSCCPALASDLKLITFQILVSTPPADSELLRWPVVRDWGPVVRFLRPQLLDWTAKARELMRTQSWRTFADRLAILDVVYGELVMLSWNSCPGMPAPTSRRPEVHRPQWDWERFDCMVARNAAWGRWRRERTTESHEDFRTKRFRSHHLVRQMKRLFWQTWLETQCRLSVENPRLAARAIRRQLGSTRRRLPSSMSSPADPNLRISGAAALSAWCNHFRDVPESAATQNQGGTQATAQNHDHAASVRRLRGSMSAESGHLDYTFAEPELLCVLSQLPLGRAAGPDGLPYEAFRVDDDCMHAALVPFLSLCVYGLLFLLSGARPL